MLLIDEKTEVEALPLISIEACYDRAKTVPVPAPSRGPNFAFLIL